jgi:hypothetical protein
MPSAQFETAELSGVQGGTHPGVIFTPAQHVPGQDRELARGGNSGHVLTAPGSDPQKEGAQRTWDTGGDPSGFDQHAAGVSASSLGDPATMDRAIS